MFLADGRLVSDLADPTEDDVSATVKELARPGSHQGDLLAPSADCRSCAAIVLGVAMVSGAYTLTDTMRGAADSLSKASYDGTAAVVSAKTAFDAGDDEGLSARADIPASTLDQVQALPGPKAVGNISDEARLLDVTAT